MQKFTILFLVGLLMMSCSNQKEKDHIYKDLIVQIVLENGLIDKLYDTPPPPPPLKIIVSNKSVEDINKLSQKVNQLEYTVGEIRDYLSKAHRLLILDKFLPFKPSAFKIPPGCWAKITYDTIWIGNIDKNATTGYKQRSVHSLKLAVPTFDISYVDNIPDPDTIVKGVKQEHPVDTLYLQLSEIILNKQSSKGLFYYAISDSRNFSGHVKFCYLQKLDNQWKIIKME